MKKVLSVLLALCLIVGAVPMFASAADSDFTIENGALVKYNGPGGDVVIPDGVTTIKAQAFRECSTLKSVIVPETVTKIEGLAFILSSIESITLPASLTSMEAPSGWANSFQYCYNLKEINLNADNPVFAVKDGVLFSKDMKKLVLYPSGSEDTSYTVPTGVTEIGSFAFHCSSNLTSLNLPEGITTIGAYALSNCDHLAEINLPKSVVSMDQGVFAGCEILTNIVIPDGVTELPRVGFSNCTGLKSVTFPAGITAIPDQLFGNCESLEDVYFYGTEEQWKNVKIDKSFNEALDKATIHFMNKPTFTDVKASDYYADAVLWAVENNITAGKGNNKFKPNDTCTRGEIVTFLWRSKGCPEPESTVNPFADVKEDAFYYKAVLWAVENHVTSGTGKDSFSPGKPCSRGEAVTFMWRSEDEPEAQGSSSFKDVAKGAFYEKAVNWAVEKGITAGKGANTFKPNDKCSRGEIVTFLYRGANG